VENVQKLRLAGTDQKVMMIGLPAAVRALGRDALAVLRLQAQK
jgi:hypothetical protein